MYENRYCIYVFHFLASIVPLISPTSILSYPPHKGPQLSVPYWPELERRSSLAVFEHVSSSGQSSGGEGPATTPSTDIDPSTGLALSEFSHFAIPLVDSHLRQILPSCRSYNLTDQDFDPITFLVKFCKKSSFNELTGTYNSFNKALHQSGTDQSTSVLRSNLVLILRCLDGLEGLHLRLGMENMLKTNAPSRYELPLETALASSRHTGHTLFASVLTSKDKADSIRNAMSVIQREQFLFNIPHAMRTNVEKGEYDLVIKDFLWAKTNFANSKVGVFTRVYDDIKSTAERFHKLLKSKLLTMPIDFDEVKRLLDLLGKLGPTDDLLWQCLVNFESWLVDRVNQLKEAYDKLKVDQRQQTSSDSSSMHRCYRPSIASIGLISTDLADALDEIAKSSSNPIEGFLQSIWLLVKTKVVQFWRIGGAYAVKIGAATGQQSRPPSIHASHSTGKLVPSSREPTPEGSPTLYTKTSSPRDYTVTHLDRWKKLNLDFISFLTNEACDYSAKSSDCSEGSDGIPACIEGCRRCMNSLPLNEMQPEIIDCFARVAYQLRRRAIRSFVGRAKSNIEMLQLKENWDTDISDQDGCITKLPLMYEEIVTQLFNRCQPLIASGSPVESLMFNSVDFRDRFPEWCCDTMTTFLKTLNLVADQIESCFYIIQLADNDKDDGEESDGSSSPGSIVSNANHRGNHHQDDEIVASDWASSDEAALHSLLSQQHPRLTSQSRGLLLVLNNAEWSARYANRRLLHLYNHLGYASSDRLADVCSTAWSDASKRLASRYSRLRLKPLTALIMRTCLATARDNTGQSDSIGLLKSITGMHPEMRMATSSLAHIMSELILLLGQGSLLATNASSSNTDSLVSSGSPLAITSDIANKMVEQLRKSFAGIEIASLPRSCQLQFCLDIAVWRFLLGDNHLLSRQAIVNLNLLSTLCSTGNKGNDAATDSSIHGSDQLTLLAPDEQSLFNQLLDMERHRFQRLSQAIRVIFNQSRPSTSGILKKSTSSKQGSHQTSPRRKVVMIQRL